VQARERLAAREVDVLDRSGVDVIAVIGAIAASYVLDLKADGVAVLGKVPSGLPSFGWPSRMGRVVDPAPHGGLESPRSRCSPSPRGSRAPRA
jgi:hypothetical protein